MNMKTGSRIIAGLGMAALLMLSTACQQAAGTDTPTPPSADQVKVNKVAATIKDGVLNTLRDGFTLALKAEAVEVTGDSINFDASKAKLGDLKTALEDGGDATIVFEGPNDKTSNIVESSSTAGTYTVTHGEKAESWKVFVKLTKKKAEKKVEIGTYTVKADDTLAELAAAAKKISVAELQGKFTPKAGTLGKDVTKVTVPAVPADLGTGISASWESSDTAITLNTQNSGAGEATVTHPAYAQGDKICNINLKLTKNLKFKYVPVVKFKVLKNAATAEEQQAEKDVAEIKKMIEQNQAAVQGKFDPTLTGGKAAIPAAVNTITVPAASSFGIELKGVTVKVGFGFHGDTAPTSKIVYSTGTSAAVTHGDNDEKWHVALILEKDGIRDHVKLGTYTVAKKAAPVKTPLSIKEIAKIAVNGVSAAGTANAYTVELEESKFNALTANAEGAKKVVIAAAAIQGLEAGSYTQADVFAVAVEDKGTTKVVKIKLAAGAEAKYTFAEVTITVTKGASGTPSAQDLVDAEAAKIKGDVLKNLQKIQKTTGSGTEALTIANTNDAVVLDTDVTAIVLPALPQTDNDVQAVWHSSVPATIATNGAVVHPAFADGDAEVIISVEFSKNTATAKKVAVAKFSVKKQAPTAQEAVNAEAAKIKGDVLKNLQKIQKTTGSGTEALTIANTNDAVVLDTDVTAIVLPALPQTENDVVAAWVSSDAAITLNTQNNGVGEASVTHTHTGDKTVTIKVKFSKSGAADKEVLVATFTVKDNT